MNGEQQVANGEWRVVQKRVASGEWRVEDHHSLLATHYSPLVAGKYGRSCAGPSRT